MRIDNNRAWSKFFITHPHAILNMGDGVGSTRNTDVRAKARKYGVVSQRYISFLRAQKLLQTNGVVLNETNKNCLFMHNSHESAKHWVIKALLFKLLRERGHTVGTEVEIKGGIVDVLDVHTFVGYEIESKPSEGLIKERLKRLWRLHDVVFIDAKKVPNDVMKAEEYIKRLVV